MKAVLTMTGYLTVHSVYQADEADYRWEGVQISHFTGMGEYKLS